MGAFLNEASCAYHEYIRHKLKARQERLKAMKAMPAHAERKRREAPLPKPVASSRGAKIPRTGRSEAEKAAPAIREETETAGDLYGDLDDGNVGQAAAKTETKSAVAAETNVSALLDDFDVDEND